METYIFRPADDGLDVDVYGRLEEREGDATSELRSHNSRIPYPNPVPCSQTTAHSCMNERKEGCLRGRG
jgi:hypothetical protein